MTTCDTADSVNVVGFEKRLGLSIIIRFFLVQIQNVRERMEEGGGRGSVLKYTEGVTLIAVCPSETGTPNYVAVCPR